MTRIRSAAFLLLALPPAAGALPPADPASQAADAAATITAPRLASAIRFLSGDELEGRGPGGRGDRLTQSWLATEMEAAGLEPGGDGGGWLQRFPIVGLRSTPDATWTLWGGSDRVDLKLTDDFVAAAGTQAPISSLTDAELVFVGYGIQAPEYGWDDFKGADLKGKVLVMLNNDPDWDDALFAGKRRLYYGRWTYKFESAARQGAAAAILIHTTASASYPWQVVQGSWSGEQFELAAGDEPRIAIQSWVTEEAAKKICALGGQDLVKLTAAARKKDFQPVPLGVTTDLNLKNEIRQVETANVAGLLPGADPKLRNEVVIYTAHHDHLGVGVADKEGDTIYNGAVDNASGTAQVLAIAKAFGALPTEARAKRSILFLFVAAEEQGLLGSEFYAAHPTLPAGRIAANINLDSANIYGRTKDITFVGYGKSKDLDRAVELAAKSQGRVVKGDQAPEKGSFYRSDQFNFARIGVPAVYLDPGTDFREPGADMKRSKQESYDSTCYHQPCDEISNDWTYDGMIEDARLAFAVGLEIANAPAMPAWNPGDEFEAARKTALAAGAGR